MMGTIWINAGLGLLAFVITLATALSSNVLLVALERAGVAFIVFFLAAFPIRWVFAIMAKTQASASSSANAGEPGSEASVAPSLPGREDGPSEEDEGTFAPLQFSRVETVHPAEDPTTVAEVVRRLTDE